MPTTIEKLWCDHNGRILCEQHIGGYLIHAIAERPRAKSHTTPLGKSFLLTAEEIKSLLKQFNKLSSGKFTFTTVCEECNYSSHKGKGKRK